MEIEVSYISNSEIENYILKNIDNSQFDEIYKFKPIIEALLTDYSKEDITKLFEELNEKA